ncbi:MAG TPA: hypothetical protein VJP76_08870, partial [Candidatus Tumulicola sp.]|nr:hypothetical protein [Candidatus Tumulicola sp.]
MLEELVEHDLGSRRSLQLDDHAHALAVRLVVELQKSATPKVVLNQLYKHTPLQSSFGFNMLALVPVGE